MWCENCEEDCDGCRHDYHSLCIDCCESREPMDWNDLD